MNRITRDQYYSILADTTSMRSNCIKRKVGCVIVKNDIILSTGYNGTPRGIKNCFDGGCERCNNSTVKSGEKLDYCKCIHAEANALLNRNIHELNGSTMYITNIPCLQCCKYIIQCCIKDIYYNKSYNIESDQKSIQFLKEGGVSVNLSTQDNTKQDS